jgi:hypothetical protein
LVIVWRGVVIEFEVAMPPETSRWRNGSQCNQEDNLGRATTHGKAEAGGGADGAVWSRILLTFIGIDPTAQTPIFATAARILAIRLFRPARGQLNGESGKSGEAASRF